MKEHELDEIRFELAPFTYGPDKIPSWTVKIFINDTDFNSEIEACVEITVDELKDSLLGSQQEKLDKVPIYGCSCGCIDCDPVYVRIVENDYIVLWSDFEAFGCKMGWSDASKKYYVFDRQKYYSEVEKIKCWSNSLNIIHSVSKVLGAWSSEKYLKYLGNILSDNCVIDFDTKSKIYAGKQEILDMFNINYVQKVKERQYNVVFKCRIVRFDDLSEYSRSWWDFEGYWPEWLVALYEYEDDTYIRPKALILLKVDECNKIYDIHIVENFRHDDISMLEG